MTQILNGSDLAEKILLKVKESHRHLLPKPRLDIVLVGGNPASLIYVDRKKEAFEDLGFSCTVHHLPATASEKDICGIIMQSNLDKACHGILVQLPLPKGIDTQAVLNMVSPAKDVDGLTTASLGCLMGGVPTFIPCTPLACMELIKTWRMDLKGLHAVVIGQSTLVGKPLGMLLLKERCTLTMTHIYTQNLSDLCRQADILVSATGHPLLVQQEWVKKGACVIDVGINHIQGKNGLELVGDVQFDTVASIAGAITPVPGGVGPVTIACLVENLLQAYKKQTS